MIIKPIIYKTFLEIFTYNTNKYKLLVNMKSIII